MIASVFSLPIQHWALRFWPILAALLAGWIAMPARGQTMPGFERAFGRTGVTRSRSEPEIPITFDSPASYVSATLFGDDATLHAVSVSPDGTTAVAVGDWGVTLRSDDAGRTWRRVPSGVEAALHDVRFLNEQRVVAVGGGYEPVTGLSRGVAVVSDDGGQSWHRADAMECTVLRRLRIRDGFDDQPLARGTIEAIGDPAEASGVNRFHSFNGGLSWQEDGTQSMESKSSIADLIESPQGLRDTRVVSGDGWHVRVGLHGMIQRCEGQPIDETAWRSVRGDGRRSAVMFVVASPVTTPWSLIGRESLEMNNRVSLVMDSQSVSSLELDRRNQHQMQHAAMRLGVADMTIRTIDEAAATLLSHRPAVVVLDQTLPPSIRDAWVTAANEHRIIVRRLYESIPLDESALVSFRGVTLREDALLTRIAALAGDLTTDALMMAAPGASSWAGVGIRAVPGSSTELRRDLSLTGGLTLAMGQHRANGETDNATRRRLQITTARMSQLGRLRDLIDDPNFRADELSQTLQVVLPQTAAEDRTRLLWRLWTMLRSKSHVDPSQPRSNEWIVCEDVLLSELIRYATTDSVRRWASCVQQARGESLERSKASGSDVASKQWFQSNDSRSASADALETKSDVAPASAWQASLSPFAVQPVSYETPMTKVSTARGLTDRGSMPRNLSDIGLTGGAGAFNLATTKRTNWEYHPIVMAARRVSAAGGDSTVNQGAGEQSSFAMSPIASRPRLDGVLDDACWANQVWHRTDDLAFACVTDRDHLYVAIVQPNAETKLAASLRLLIDGDGDLLSAFELQCFASGDRHASIDGSLTWNPTWYAAMNGWTAASVSEASQSGMMVLAEIAIPLSEITNVSNDSETNSRLAVRVSSDQAASRDNNFQTLPNPQRWRFYTLPR